MSRLLEASDNESQSYGLAFNDFQQQLAFTGSPHLLRDAKSRRGADQHDSSSLDPSAVSRSVMEITGKVVAERETA